jgi:hypothetical protein
MENELSLDYKEDFPVHFLKTFVFRLYLAKYCLVEESLLQSSE